MLRGILLGVGHIQVSVDLLHIERSKPRRDFTIYEWWLTIAAGKIDQIEFCIVNLDMPGTDIGHVEIRRSTRSQLGNGLAFVHRTFGGRGVSGVVYD
jgi:hypothetical protein